MDMDRISVLPEALLLRILSSVPTKDAVATSVLSKRWQYLWKMLPNLEFNDFNRKTEFERFSTFVYRSLLSHKAPVLQSLCLKVSCRCSPTDIEIWVGIAIERGVRELHVYLYSSDMGAPSKLPSSVYTSQTLETLKLLNNVLVYVPSPVCLRSLKTLHLQGVRYEDGDSVCRLLSSCPVLQDLLVERDHWDKVETFTIAVPSLQRLFISNDNEGYDHVYQIIAPALKYLIIDHEHWSNSNEIEYLPELVEADIVTFSSQCMKLLRSLTSVKRLSLNLSIVEKPYPTGDTFHRLVHLEIFTCAGGWWNLLMHMLEVSPKLQALKLRNISNYSEGPPVDHWLRPSSVPKCVSLRLKTFKWKDYEGTPQEKKVATYFLRNARQLKTAKFSPEFADSDEKLLMLKELASEARGSTKCKIVVK